MLFEERWVGGCVGGEGDDGGVGEAGAFAEGWRCWDILATHSFK